MKNLFLASLLFWGVTASGQKTAVSIHQTEFLVKDKDTGTPLPNVEALLHKKIVGVSDAQGILWLEGMKQGDTLLFREMPHISTVERKSFESVFFIVPENSYQKKQEIQLKGYYPEIMDPPAFIYNEKVPDIPPSPPENSEINNVVDEPASFPGGAQTMRTFMGRNIVYPPSAIENGLQGKCYLKFIVHKDGTITDIQVARGVPNCPECDKEAIRLVKSMPKWIPGKNKGVAVDSYYNLPIHFALKQ